MGLKKLWQKPTHYQYSKDLPVDLHLSLSDGKGQKQVKVIFTTKPQFL